MDVASPVDKAADIANKIIRPRLQTDIPKWVANNARKLVLAERNGTFESSYTKAPQLVTAATSLNPNSIGHFIWSKEGQDNRFESVIVDYDVHVKGFLHGCRLVIGLDGAHLNGKLGGVMLSAVGIDGQNGVFPICVMICMSETEEKWHLYKNFLTKGFRNPRLTHLLWQAAKANKYHRWEEAMQEIAEISSVAYQYLIDAEPKSWEKSWFPHDVACDHIYSNFSESFNNMALKFRVKPLTQLIDMYTHLVMVLFSNRKKLAATWKAGDLVPAGKDLIKVMCDLRGNYECDPSIERKVYEVTNKAISKVFVVRVEEKSCTCRQWQLKKFPCIHGVVALFKLNPDWSKYCSKYYIVDYYRTTYSWSITPLGDIDEYPNKTGIKIIHPHRLRDNGRPCVKRKKSWSSSWIQPKKEGVRMECSVNGDEFCITAAPTKKMRKALSAPNTASTSASKKATSSASKKSAETYHGTVNISSQTINISEPPSKRIRKLNSKYQ
ncbi:uncharacterized protein LOC113279518 [Papaver somniferum]|uniref:uncharacterized protein LOC113279518 n=1 Tax=Papaver somniferum TaxID=3469 RepID=UPI000E703A1E|nr:uncharacterized protein LOC113279518 [Papaver somniferum]